MFAEELQEDEKHRFDAATLTFDEALLAQLDTQGLRVAHFLVGEDAFHLLGQILSTVLREGEKPLRETQLRVAIGREKDTRLGQHRHFVLLMDEQTEGRAIVQEEIVLLLTKEQLQVQLVILLAGQIVHGPIGTNRLDLLRLDVRPMVESVTIAVVRMEQQR